MFFAHLFNRRENYHVHLDHLPPREDYMYSSFTTAKQIIFDEWSLFLEEGGLDPFIEATTIASTCMKLYRHFFLPEKTLAIIPENGYQRHSKASEIALKYLTWVGHKTGKAIQHRNTLEGEKKIGDYLVDGFIQDENRVIEVLGCYWHGHIKKCVEPDTMLPKKRTAEAEYFNTMKRINAIRAHGYEVDMVWECEIHEQLKSNNEMAEFFNDCILGGPIDPRDGYFGGRCNPHKIHSVKTPGRKIRYLDFTSLYPSTNLLEYPIGIPEIKVMADGWPPNVQTDAQKAQFVREYKELFDVDIDPFKVVRNPGLRYIAKLCLNSLWGRFSLRNTLSKCIVTDDPLELDNIVNNSTLDVVSIDLLNESQVMVVYNVKKPFIVEHNCSNIIISLYTTSAARVTLFRAMDKVINTPYAYMIYTDTDSLLFETLEDVEILQTGNYLGDLTDEVGPNEEIIEVVIGGNKQYGYVLRNKETGELRYILKIRGITLDAKTCTKLHYEKFKKMVLEYSEDDVIDLEYQRLLPSRLGNVRSANIPKRYKVVYKKGHIGSDLIVYPFGYQE
uniref:DNA-directed DNA polymerase n=1 Tax=Panagrolaimus davidi TaxID=227884 RepID=A0A914QLQ6_9BILA